MANILYVDDEQENLIVFEAFFKRFYRVFTANAASKAKQILSAENIDLLLTDQRMPVETGTQLLEYSMEKFPDIQRILVTGYSDMDAIIKAINHCKVFYYITKPWDVNDFKLVIDRAVEARTIKRDNEKLLGDLVAVNKQLKEKNSYLQDANEEIKKLKARLETENQYLKKEISQTFNSDEIVFRSSAYETIINKIRVVAPTNSTVLITGETGTGKELLARAIHKMSNRADKNYIKLNCATIPASLMESELFGHVKGSFTGAINNKIGLFELANGGTIFLDEIGELPLDLQSKLLRVLQEGEFMRIGDTKTLKSDVRVIAATNRDLQVRMKEGQFRSDLFFRLNVFPIHNLRLSERKEDIPALVEHFVKKLSTKVGKTVSKVPKETLSALRLHDWPGNIRELENFVERSIILSSDETLELHGWEPVLSVAKPEITDSASLEMSEAERNHIIRVLEMTNWRIRGKGGAAEILNLKPTTLSSKMKKLGISNIK